jgi:hypothetical protein
LTIKSSTIKRRGYHINTSSFATKFVELHEKTITNILQSFSW